MLSLSPMSYCHQHVMSSSTIPIPETQRPIIKFQKRSASHKNLLAIPVLIEPSMAISGVRQAKFLPYQSPSSHTPIAVAKFLARQSS